MIQAPPRMIIRRKLSRPRQICISQVSSHSHVQLRDFKLISITNHIIGFDKRYPSRVVSRSHGLTFNVYNDPNVKQRRAVDEMVTGAHLREIFGAHTSEDQWALPEGHEHHLLSFPLGKKPELF